MAKKSKPTPVKDYSLIATIKTAKWSFKLDEIKCETLKKFSKEIFDRMDSYFNGHTTVPCAINAPYRTGKSEFLFTCFRKTFNNGHLALYGNLEKYLKLMEKYKKDDFSEALRLLIKDQKKLITDVFINSSRKDELNNILLPEINSYEEKPIEDYLKNNICSVSEITVTDFDKILNKEDLKIVVLIDEMEEGYKDLRDLYGQDKKEPLRSTYQLVNQSSPPYMTILAYGMISVIESMKFDQEGRKFSISISIIPPEDFKDEKEYKNFWWWVSRARWGWYNKYVREIKVDVPFQDIVSKIKDEEVDNVKLFDYNNLKNRAEILADGKIHDIMKKSILEIFPHQIDLKKDTGKDAFQFDYDNFYFSTKLTTLDEIRNALSDDFKELTTKDDKFKDLFNNTDTDISTFYDYLRYILEAISNEKFEISLGYITNSNVFQGMKFDCIRYYFLVPLFQLIRDLVIEYKEGDTEILLLELLDHLIEIKDQYSFTKINNLFERIEGTPDPKYYQISLRTITTLFPRPIYDPIINFNHPPKEKDYDLLKLLKTGAKNDLYIFKHSEIDNLDIFYFLIETKEDIELFADTDCLIDNSYDRDSMFIFLINAKKDKYVEIEKELREKVLIEEKYEYLIKIKKVNYIEFKEERLSLFIKSLFFETQDYVNPLIIEKKIWKARIDHIIAEINKSKLMQRDKKKKRKSIEFFNGLLENKLDDLSKLIITAYKEKLEDNFNLGEKNSVQTLIDGVEAFFSSNVAGRAANALQVLLLYSAKLENKVNLLNKIKERWFTLHKFLSIGLKDNKIDVFPNPTHLETKSSGFNRLLQHCLSPQSLSAANAHKRKFLGLMDKIDKFFISTTNKNAFNIGFKNLCLKFPLDSTRVDLKEFKLEPLTSFIKKLDYPKDFSEMFPHFKKDESKQKWVHIMELYHNIVFIPIPELKKKLDEILKSFNKSIIAKYNTFLKNIEDLNKQLISRDVRGYYFYYEKGFKNFKQELNIFYNFFEKEIVTLKASSPLYYWAILIVQRVESRLALYLKALNDSLDNFKNSAMSIIAFQGKKKSLQDQLKQLVNDFRTNLKDPKLDLATVILEKKNIPDLNKKYIELNKKLDLFITNELLKKVLKDEIKKHEVNQFIHWWVAGTNDLTFKNLLDKVENQSPGAVVNNEIKEYEKFYTDLKNLYDESLLLLQNYKDVYKLLEDVDNLLKV